MSLNGKASKGQAPDGRGTGHDSAELIFKLPPCAGAFSAVQVSWALKATKGELGPNGKFPYNWNECPPKDVDEALWVGKLAGARIVYPLLGLHWPSKTYVASIRARGAEGTKFAHWSEPSSGFQTKSDSQLGKNPMPSASSGSNLQPENAKSKRPLTTEESAAEDAPTSKRPAKAAVPPAGDAAETSEVEQGIWLPTVPLAGDAVETSEVEQGIWLSREKAEAARRLSELRAASDQSLRSEAALPHAGAEDATMSETGGAVASGVLSHPAAGAGAPAKRYTYEAYLEEGDFVMQFAEVKVQFAARVWTTLPSHKTFAESIWAGSGNSTVNLATWSKDSNKSHAAPSGLKWRFRRELLPSAHSVSAGAPTGLPALALQHKFLDFAKRLDFDEVRKLVEADVRYVNVQALSATGCRWTALHQACYVGNSEMVEFLLDRGADAMLVDNEGVTPKERAAPGSRSEFSPGRHRECIALIDAVLMQAAFSPLVFSMEKLRNVMDVLLCTKPDTELTLKTVLSWLEQKLLPPGDSRSLRQYKRGIESEFLASMQRLRPSKPTSIEELRGYHDQLQDDVKVHQWSAVLDSLLEMHKLEVSVPMLKKTPSLMTYLKKSLAIIEELPEESKEAAAHLHTIWYAKGKTAPKCKGWIPPALVEDGATDQSLALTLVVPESETEITAIVVKYRRSNTTVSHEEQTATAEKHEALAVPTSFWQGRAAGEPFTWVLNPQQPRVPLEAGTSYDICVYATGTEDCWAKGNRSKDTEWSKCATLEVTDVAQLKDLNAKLVGFMKGDPVDSEAIQSVLNLICKKHATVQVVRESRSIMHTLKRIEGEVSAAWTHCNKQHSSRPPTRHTHHVTTCGSLNRSERPRGRSASASATCSRNLLGRWKHLF